MALVVQGWMQGGEVPVAPEEGEFHVAPALLIEDFARQRAVAVAVTATTLAGSGHFQEIPRSSVVHL